MYPGRVKAKDAKNDYIIYHPVGCSKIPALLSQDIPIDGSQSVSIDIGVKHFAIRIEKRYQNGSIVPIFFDKIDFTKYNQTSENTATTVINPEVLDAAHHFFQSLLPLLRESRIIGIERQLAVNYIGTRMFQHILTILLVYVTTFKYPCVIMDISPKLKGRLLNAPKGLKYIELKKWGIDKAAEILTARNDKESLNILMKHKGRSKTKGDDLADTVLQMEAWHILTGGITTKLSVTGRYI